mgnify:CR=1 FL=1
MLHGRKLRGDGVGRVRQRSLARILLLSVLLGGFSSADAQQPGGASLILYPDSNANRSALVVGEAIRKRLLERSARTSKRMGNFSIFRNFQTTGTRQRVVRYLAEKYAAHRTRCRGGAWSDSLRTVVNNRSLRFPTFRSCLLRVAGKTCQHRSAPRRARIINEFDISKTVSLAERLQPDARHLVVIAGAAPFDQRWAQIAR